MKSITGYDYQMNQYNQWRVLLVMIIKWINKMIDWYLFYHERRGQDEAGGRTGAPHAKIRETVHAKWRQCNSQRVELFALALVPILPRACLLPYIQLFFLLISMKFLYCPRCYYRCCIYNSRPNRAPMDPDLSLPDDSLYHVLSYLTPRDLHAFSKIQPQTSQLNLNCYSYNNLMKASLSNRKASLSNSLNRSSTLNALRH